jgi:hypothetical protein
VRHRRRVLATPRATEGGRVENRDKEGNRAFALGLGSLVVACMERLVCFQRWQLASVGQTNLQIPTRQRN